MLINQSSVAEDGRIDITSPIKTDEKHRLDEVTMHTETKKSRLSLITQNRGNHLRYKICFGGTR